MLDSVLLVLREVLEAALFISLLLALGLHLGMRGRWARAAVPLGLLASWVLSRFAFQLAEAFDGIGQELANGALYAVAILSFIALAALIAPSIIERNRTPSADRRAVQALFVLIVVCSMAREGSEIWIYLSSFAGQPGPMSAAIMGGLIGTGIGLSLCALVYYAFAFLSRRAFLATFFVLSALVAGGLSMQLAKLGLQIGWLDSGRPIWDTSWLVDERSWFGQFLHALFGYDANPDALQAAFHFATLVAVALATMLQVARVRRRADA